MCGRLLTESDRVDARATHVTYRVMTRMCFLVLKYLVPQEMIAFEAVAAYRRSLVCPETITSNCVMYAVGHDCSCGTSPVIPCRGSCLCWPPVLVCEFLSGFFCVEYTSDQCVGVEIPPRCARDDRFLSKLTDVTLSHTLACDAHELCHVWFWS